MEKLASGSRILDKLLEGGYEPDILTTIFGPAGSGKTNLCILCAVNTARLGKKVIYIDTENNFSLERCKQICAALKQDYLKIINNMVFLKPTTFTEQKKTLEKLKELVNDKIGLVVIDSIAMLYRLELGKNTDIYELNRDLGNQLSFLTELARKNKVPILVTNQVYADFENRDKVNMVGGDLLKYGSKCLLEIEKLSAGNRKATVRKHRAIEEGKAIVFKIVEGGILGTKIGSGFTQLFRK